MALLVILRLLTSFLSLALLGVAIYLGWSWYEGDAYYNDDGLLVQIREDWRLWAAGALLAWSVLGRFAMGIVLGRPDTARTRLKLERGQGEFFDTPTGATVYVER